MPVPPLPESLARDLEPLLEDLPRDIFTPSFYAACELVDGYVLEWSVELAHELGLPAELTAFRTARRLASRCGFAPPFETALRWLLERLATAGLLAAEGPRGPGRAYRLPAPLRESRRGACRQAALEVDGRIQRSLALLDAAGDAYPAVARGRMRGEEALLGPGKVALWCDYFHNDNPYYSICNRVAAAAAAARLPRRAARILEVGAGAGSATSALLQELADRGVAVAGYRVTEPVPILRARCQRALSHHPAAPLLAFGPLDIDLGWAEQGVPRASLDLVYCVNVLHVARHLLATLGECLRSLAPGGWLVAGECLRPRRGEPVPAEFVFQILDGFLEVEIDAELRPNPGFLTPEQWGTALAAAGFSVPGVVPEIARIREIYPRFYAGAVVARRPPAEDAV